jgi:predicted peroxiredoxin
MSVSDLQPGKKLALLLHAARPDQGETCLMPFVYAMTAAAMDVEVEMHFTGQSVRLLVDGVACNIPTANGPHNTLYDSMQQAAQLGVRFIACSMALQAHVGAHETRIAEFGGVAGAASLILRSLDPEWRLLQF